MEDLGQLLFEKIKELVELEVQEIELKFAIFNNRALSKYNEKVELINENFIQQSKFYGKKVEDYENEKNDIIDKYNKEFQKIYDKRRIQYINIVNEIREMQSNQKIALANIENLYSEWDSLIDSKEQKEGSTNLFDEINKKLLALTDKYEKYDGVILECEKKLDDCIVALEEDFNSIMKYRNNSLIVPKKENFLVKLFNKIFGGNKKFKKEVIDKMNFEIDDIQKNDSKLLEIIDSQTVLLVAKIEELRQQINLEYSTATENS